MIFHSSQVVFPFSPTSFCVVSLAQIFESPNFMDHCLPSAWILISLQFKNLVYFNFISYSIPMASNFNEKLFIGFSLFTLLCLDRTMLRYYVIRNTFWLFDSILDIPNSYFVLKFRSFSCSWKIQMFKGPVYFQAWYTVVSLLNLDWETENPLN